MSDSDRRFYFIPPDDPSGTRDIICVGLPDIAEHFAIELGEGAHIVDTLAAPYYPMVRAFLAKGCDANATDRHGAVLAAGQGRCGSRASAD